MTTVTKTAIQDIRDAVTQKRDSLTLGVTIDDIQGGAMDIIIVPSSAEDNATRIMVHPCGDVEVYQIEGDTPSVDDTLMSINFGIDGIMARTKDGVVIDTSEYSKPLTGKQLIDKIVSEFEPNLAYLDTLHVKGE